LKIRTCRGVWAVGGLLVAAAIVGAGSVAAGAAPVTIAALQGNTAVAAYGGVAAWSDYDTAEKSWNVLVRRDGQISTTSVPSAGKAIEVAVGPGPSGPQVLAYLSCAGKCHLVVSALNGSDPRAIPGTQGASHPTVWGERVA
jgi:hypothetical protein